MEHKPFHKGKREGVGLSGVTPPSAQKAVGHRSAHVPTLPLSSLDMRGFFASRNESLTLVPFSAPHEVQRALVH